MAEYHAGDCHQMYNPATSKITETRDVIRLHRMFYQDNIDGEAALLPEVRVDVPELANVDPEVTAYLSQGKREPGGTDPVYDEDEVENELALLAGATRTAGAGDGSNIDEAREGEPKDEDSTFFGI
eukprot:scaffold65232_cov49-Cyclotella_meneghiniana.AAC.6